MRNILNFPALAKNELRRKALVLADAGYEAINIKRSVKKRIINDNGILKILSADGSAEYETDIKNYKNVLLAGIGKGSYDAVSAIRKNLKRRIKRTIVLDSRRIPFSALRNILRPDLSAYEGTHPMPSKKNVAATRKIMTLAENLTENDLLIFFVCGGGSALACSSENEMEQSTYAIKELTKRGADITELNTVRKHLSVFKGGGLAKIAHPASVISLVASDVCGNDLSMVASGPTILDETVKEDADRILAKYGIEKDGLEFSETPKDGKYFERVKNLMFVCNKSVISAMQEKAGQMGIASTVYSLTVRGEAKAALLPIISKTDGSAAVLAAGETTITFNVDIPGAGGRSMEAVLGGLNHFNRNGGFPGNLVLLSLASDGRDNTDAAGALADFTTLAKARSLGIDIAESLRTHDTYEFFRKTGDLVFATKKSFNVADFMIILKQD